MRYTKKNELRSCLFVKMKRNFISTLRFDSQNGDYNPRNSQEAAAWLVVSKELGRDGTDEGIRQLSGILEIQRNASSTLVIMEKMVLRFLTQHSYRYSIDFSEFLSQQKRQEHKNGTPTPASFPNKNLLLNKKKLISLARFDRILFCI